MMMISTTEPASVRPLRPDDVNAVVDLVGEQEFARGQSRDALRLLFDYPWSPDKPNTGYVLTVGDTIVGAAGLVYSTRTIDGCEHRFANTTTWYVAPEYRRYSHLMMKTALSLEDYTLVSLSAAPHVAQTLEKAGFEVLSRRRLFFGPFAGPLTALARDGQILDAEPEVARVLSDEHRRILEDHLPFGCRHYVVKERDRYCYLVTRRRWEKGWFLPRVAPDRLRERRYPVSDVLFVSDAAVALRHWLPLRWRMMRRERSVGVTAEESFLGDLAPAAVSTPHRIHVLRRRTPPRSIDALYSERVLLTH